MAQNQSGYTGAQISSMQNDAMRRVNEMQRQAQQKLNQTQGYILQQPDKKNLHSENFVPTNKSVQPKEKIDRCETEIVNNGFAGILDRLNLDDEKIILIMLIILLVNEGADIMLILALGFILL